MFGDVSQRLKNEGESSMDITTSHIELNKTYGSGFNTASLNKTSGSG